MQDMHAQLETLLREAANCELISNLATNAAKKDLFAKLAEHHRVLAAEVQRADQDVRRHDQRPRNVLISTR
jgi:hypothetical protein